MQYSLAYVPGMKQRTRAEVAKEEIQQAIPQPQVVFDAPPSDKPAYIPEAVMQPNGQYCPVYYDNNMKEYGFWNQWGIWESYDAHGSQYYRSVFSKEAPVVDNSMPMYAVVLLAIPVLLVVLTSTLLILKLTRLNKKNEKL